MQQEQTGSRKTALVDASMQSHGSWDLDACQNLMDCCPSEQSGDGGLYGELIRNRAFQGSGIRPGRLDQIPYVSVVSSENPTIPFGPVLDGWSGIGDVRLSLNLLHPLSDSLPVALQVDVLQNATGEVGIKNDGWWGIHVAPQAYAASFYVQADGVRFNWTITQFQASLRSNLTNEIWSINTIPVEGRLGPFAYTHYNTTLPNTAVAPNVNNTFAITWNAEESAGQTLYFDLISLFGENYRGRKNGLRKDLAEQLEAMKPKFLRFPGGNALEGYSIQTRWKWWKTIGPLRDRPGRPGDWTYYTTDGLGLLEYLEWCEDMSLQPLLAVYAGFSLSLSAYDQGNSTDANEYPMEFMDEVLEEALAELEYCMGDPHKTYWGKQRAIHGHPEPFNIPMIEIGNEDFFSHNYPQRAKFMYEGLLEHYPDITYIFTALNESSEFKHRIPKGGVWDSHLYIPAGAFIERFDEFDHFQEHGHQKNVMASLMEYHVSGVHGVGFDNPRMASAVGEAVYAIAGERNPDVFRLSCFAPAIQNLNAYRHTPYDILFDADPAQTVLSVSYYQQQMFNTWQGLQTLPVTEKKGGLNPLFWVASIHEGLQAVYFKVVNAGNTTQSLDIELDVAWDWVNGTILEPPILADLNAFNYIGNVTIVPTPITFKGAYGDSKFSKREFSWTVPAYSISVLQFNLRGSKSTHGENSADIEQGFLVQYPRSRT